MAEPSRFLFFFFKDIFLMRTIFKVFIEFVTILPLFIFCFFWPQGMWDLSSPTRARTRTPCVGRRHLHPWTTREGKSPSRFIYPKTPGAFRWLRRCICEPEPWAELMGGRGWGLSHLVERDQVWQRPRAETRSGRVFF